MGIYKFKNLTPKIHPTAYIDCKARIVGNVKVGENTTIHYGAIVRGDDEEVVIGCNVAVLENCIVEAPKDNPVKIGDKTLISHGAIIHGATIGRQCLIGIGAIILDGAVIEDEAIVAAGSVVTPNTIVKRRSLVGGVPARYIREVKNEELQVLKEELSRILLKCKEYEKVIRCD